MEKKQKESNSKESQKKYKQFTLDKKPDYIRYLNTLISAVHVELKKYKSYFKELSLIIEEYSNENDNEIKDIPAYIYESIDDKLFAKSMRLVNLVGDHQVSSFSYIKFRALLDKSQFSKSVDKLDSDMQTLLNEFRSIRNWMLHNPESLLTGQEELMMKKLPQEERNRHLFMTIKNPIKVGITGYYEGYCILSLYYHTDLRIKNLTKLFQQMKKDYSNLIEESVQIQTIYVSDPMKIDDDSSKIAQFSGYLQTHKYNGSDEEFSKIQEIFEKFNTNQ